MKTFFDVAADKIWDCYRAESKRSLAQQIRRLKEWVEKNIDNCAMKDNILKLCKKKDRWMQHFNCISAHRTSNMVDRLMRAIKKHAYNSQMFHSKNISKTTDNCRAFALLYNFTPSCPQVWKDNHSWKSPAARLGSSQKIIHPFSTNLNLYFAYLFSNNSLFFNKIDSSKPKFQQFSI